MSKKEEQNRLTEKNLENFLKMMERLRCLGWKGGNLITSRAAPSHTPRRRTTCIEPRTR